MISVFVRDFPFLQEMKARLDFRRSLGSGPWAHFPEQRLEIEPR